MTEHILAHLKEHDGIWRTEALQDVSYPADGNETCYQVEDKSFWFKHRNQIILTLFQQHVTQDGLVLGVGGGNGFVSKALQHAGYETMLLEPFLEGCRNAKHRNVKHIVHGTLGDAQFENSSFDAVGLFDVLEHLEDRQSFLAEIARVLKPDVKLILSVPSFNHLWSEEDVDAGHFLRYTTKSLIEELAGEEFYPVFDSYIFSFLTGPIFFFRSLPNKLNLTLKRTAQADHTGRDWFSSLLSFEKARIKKQRRIPYGSSLIAVCQKIKKK